MGVIFPLTSLLDDDMQRRKIDQTRWFWPIALVPLFGPLMYLCWRPKLPDRDRQIFERFAYSKAAIHQSEL